MITTILVLLSILAIALLLSGIIATLLGGLVLFHLMKSKQYPMDSSNRINHIRLFWFALTKPHLFVKTFEWLKNDEEDNFSD